MLEALVHTLEATWQGLDATRLLMLWLGGLAVAVTALEGLLIGWRRGSPAAYDWPAFWTTVRINGWRAVVEALPMGAFLGASLPLGQWMFEHRLVTVPMDTAWGWVAMFFTTEFFYYWMHRAGHRIRWFWASHQVHHSGNQYNLAAAFRQSITGKVSGAFLFFAPQCWLGFPPEAVLFSYALNLVYQFWIHTDLVGRLGWLEGILNTPSAHRVHHAANVQYLDANYGGTLLLFDRIFGTHVPEVPGVAITYGLVKPVTTHSAWRICLAEWLSLAHDMWASTSLRQALGHAVMPPGWAPGGRGLTTEALRATMRQLTGSASGVVPQAVFEGRLDGLGEAVTAPGPASGPGSGPGDAVSRWPAPAP